MTPRSVLITGANRGIGLELVRQFINLDQPPTHIIATCRRPDTAQELILLEKMHSNVHVFQLEVTDYSQLPALVDQVRDKVCDTGLNLLINNAGIDDKSGLRDVTADDIRTSFEVNSIAPLMISKAFLPLLEKAVSANPGQSPGWSKAAIVNISSGYGSLSGSNGGLYPYRMSKAALNMATVSCAKDLRSSGILVVALTPGWVQTDMGGSTATLTPQQSVSKLINNMKLMNETRSGLLISIQNKPRNY